MSSLDSIRKTYPLMPLRDIVLFPHMVAPLVVGRERSIKALENAMSFKKDIFLATQKDAAVDEPSKEGIYTVGTVGTILQLLKLPDGTIKALVEGRQRAQITHFLANETFFLAEVELIAETLGSGSEMEAYLREIRGAFEEYAKLNKKVPREIVTSLANIDNPSQFVDVVAAHLPLKTRDKQDLLEAGVVVQRMEMALGFIRAEIEIAKLEQRIRSRVKNKMEKTQRDYYLAEQLRAIQKEMGSKDEAGADLADLERSIKKKRLPKAVMAKVKAELKKLKMMPPMSAEATVVRNYIDWIITLPWFEKTKAKIDITEAERILEEDHYGLQKPKERILEYLAVQAQVKQIKGPILCLVGPPGVGKTSLSKSIARSMGRKFIRLSLGGVRDEAEIRGHRRTYIGAMPGKIIQSLQKAKVSNPLFCLDEVDKMSMDFRGDPSAALLEVLDPEQNYAFNDHYLDVDYDLSDVFFITTANNLPSIPPPLQDRMEIIKLSGYTEEEKLNIAKSFLVPKQIEVNGFEPDAIVFTDNALLEIIRRYTREAGVRNLERSISAVCRKVARERLKNNSERKYRIAPIAVSKYLGVPKYRFGMTEEKDEIGLSTGLAWTEVGGELLQIETVLMPGKGKLTITGKLGEVMQESAQAALSYVRSRALCLGLTPDFYQKLDIHVHVPEGAIPKDGPSAGITIATSMVSALLKIPVHKAVAMTGEITLRGRVLPIGGLTEKLLAAKRGNVDRVLIPKDNERDLREVSPKIRKSLEIEFVEHMDEVLKKTLVLEDPESLFRDVPPGAVCADITLVASNLAH